MHELHCVHNLCWFRQFGRSVICTCIRIAYDKLARSLQAPTMKYVFLTGSVLAATLGREQEKCTHRQRKERPIEENEHDKGIAKELNEECACVCGRNEMDDKNILSWP